MASDLTIIVGQSGGPSAVINETLAGVIEEARRQRVKRILGLRNGIEGGGLHPDIPGNVVDLSGVDIEQFRRNPGAYLGSTRLKIGEKNKDLIGVVKANFESYGNPRGIYIGGNDSADTADQAEWIHAQKTIDNDLKGNDHTSGYGSACISNIAMVKALEMDMSSFSPKIRHGGKIVYSTAPVVVYETQGRNTGWLALGTAFARMRGKSLDSIDENAAPHIILPREIPYCHEQFLAAVDNQLRRTGFAFVVCPEELVNAEGKPLSEVHGAKEEKDDFGHVEHGRAGAFVYAEFLAREIKKGLKAGADVGYLKVKETPFSPRHIQRCLLRSEVDAREAYATGVEAVRAAIDGERKVSIALKRNGDGYNIAPVRIPTSVVANQVRQVPQDYLGTILGPTPKFYKDFAPLIRGE